MTTTEHKTELDQMPPGRLTAQTIGIEPGPNFELPVMALDSLPAEEAQDV
ncbi:hypothetical protein [Nocardioides sp. URHA0032]|nr:hypothetical protein [Nocardioides sp. URHA0032]